MRNPLGQSSLKRAAMAGTVALMVVLGVGGVLKTTVDYLLFWDATGAAESWARYVAENVTDIEQIAGGAEPSAASMSFFIRTQQIRYVFGFEIIDLKGNVQLGSDGSKILILRGAIQSPTAAKAAEAGRPIVSVKEGTPPIRPKHYAEAYLPVIVNNQPRAVVAAYVDLSEQYAHFRAVFLASALALCLLGGLGAGLPTFAWHSMMKEKQRADQRIRYLAHHDGLTGLSNRTRFLEQLDIAIGQLKPEGVGFAIHFIDLDYFKTVNDTLGHDGGDFLLKTTAERLRSVKRDGDEVTRFGGDEFVVLQAEVRTRADAQAFAMRVAETVTQPIRFGDHEINPSISLGFAVAPFDGKAPDPLLKCADLAVYQAKADGRGCVRGFVSTMDAAQKRRVELEQMLRRALREDGFVLHYQPIYAIEGRALIGFEALIRMTAEDGTLIPPMSFIPIAEELHLIDRIGAWVLRTACATAATWPEHLTVSVNISPAHFELGTLSADVADALGESGLAACRLELEVTENTLLRESDRLMSQLRALKAMGVAIVMDDFGKGYSSLSYLWRFPFDKIKIDQSFMAGIASAGRNVETVARTIIELGHELNMRVIVEGVETDQQVAFLDEVHGDQAQGYYFGRPMPAADLAASIMADLERQRAPAADGDAAKKPSGEAAA